MWHKSHFIHRTRNLKNHRASLWGIICQQAILSRKERKKERETFSITTNNFIQCKTWDILHLCQQLHAMSNKKSRNNLHFSQQLHEMSNKISKEHSVSLPTISCNVRQNKHRHKHFCHNFMQCKTKTRDIQYLYQQFHAM